MATWYVKPTATDVGDVNSYAPNADYSGSAPSMLSDLASDDIFINEGHLAFATNPTALAAIDIASWTVGPKFDGTLGSEGNPIELLMTAGSPSKLNIGAPRANCYVKSASTIEQVNVSTGGGGRVRLTGATFSDVRLYSGALYIDDCVVTAMFMSGGLLEAIYKSTAFTTFILTGGNALTRRTITTATIDGPSAKLITDLSAVLTTANVQGGGVLNLRGYAAAAVGTLNSYRGVITPQDALANQVITTHNNYGGPEAVKLYSSWGLRTLTQGTYNDYGGAGTITNPKGGIGSESFTP